MTATCTRTRARAWALFDLSVRVWLRYLDPIIRWRHGQTRVVDPPRARRRRPTRVGLLFRPKDRAGGAKNFLRVDLGDHGDSCFVATDT